MLCTILTDIAQALSSGRCVLVGIDMGATAQLHAFNSPGDPNALLIAEELHRRVRAQALAEIPPPQGAVH